MDISALIDDPARASDHGTQPGERDVEVPHVTEGVAVAEVLDVFGGKQEEAFGMTEFEWSEFLVDKMLESPSMLIQHILAPMMCPSFGDTLRWSLMRSLQDMANQKLAELDPE